MYYTPDWLIDLLLERNEHQLVNTIFAGDTIIKEYIVYIKGHEIKVSRNTQAPNSIIIKQEV